MLTDDGSVERDLRNRYVRTYTQGLLVVQVSSLPGQRHRVRVGAGGWSRSPDVGTMVA